MAKKRKTKKQKVIKKKYFVVSVNYYFDTEDKYSLDDIVSLKDRLQFDYTATITETKVEEAPSDAIIF